MNKTTVYFVRHCQPDYSNHNDLLRPLTEKGERDAIGVSEFFMDKGVDVVLSSPYIRAMDTVIGVADDIDAEVETDFDFRERRVADGSWIDDIEDFIKKQWADFDYKLPEGESLREVQERNINALMRAVKNHPEKTIVIGSHGTALSTIINYFDNSFGYKDFMTIIDKMPWIVKLEFTGEKLDSINLL